MLRTQPRALLGWQQVCGNGGLGNSWDLAGGWVCSLVLTTSKGVTKIRVLSETTFVHLHRHILVRAVSVDPVAAAISFALNGSIRQGDFLSRLERKRRVSDSWPVSTSQRWSMPSSRSTTSKFVALVRRGGLALSSVRGGNFCWRMARSQTQMLVSDVENNVWRYKEAFHVRNSY